jgi:hypothetical protein
MSTEKRKFVIMPYKLCELAEIYKCSCYFMRLRINRHEQQIGKKDGHFYSYEQVELIFKLVHLPSDVEIIM